MSDSLNPYASPALEASIDELQASGRPLIPVCASLWLRFANFIIDYVVVQMVAALLLGIVAVLVWGEKTLDEDYVRSIAFALVFVVYAVCEAAYQRTLGKLITGTKVVNEVGGPPTIGQAIGRTLCRFIPFELFSYFIREDHRGWHDSIPKT